MIAKKVLLLAAALLAANVFSNPTSFLPGPISRKADAVAPLSAESKKSAGKPQPKVVAGAYIVQLETKGSLARRAADLHNEFHLIARQDAGLDYSVRETFSEESVFVGLSLNIHEGDVQALKDLKNVAAVWPVKTVPAPSAALPRDYKKRAANVARADSPLPYVTGELDVNRPHTMTGVDKVHAAGIRGKKIKIGIIDTGVDYRHPSLGGCFGEGCKIAFGYDFAGDDYNPDYGIPAVEKPDPLVTCVTGGHGSHVSGIVAMLDQPGTGFGLVGVAPEATLGMYRIFGCEGGADDDIIMKALLKAGSDGVDVISMSFGQVWPDEDTNPYSVIADNLLAKGIAMFAATGNSGSWGLMSPSSPAISSSIFAVGSVDNEKFPLTYQLTDSNGRHLRYSAHLPQQSPSEGLTVQVMHYGADPFWQTGPYIEDYEQAAANLTALGIDPATVILATLYGSHSPASKAEVAAGLGYKYFLQFTTEEEDPFWGKEYNSGDPAEWPLEPISLTVQDSKTLLSSFGKMPFQYKIFLNSTDHAAKSVVASTPRTMSNFSSIGPTLQLNLKPQLSAPGGNILSTWPLTYNGYTIISGTSMATPYMAGAYALIKSQKPKLSVPQIYSLMQNTGKTLPWYYNKNIKSSAVHQGAGLLNVQNALAYESVITPTQLSAGLSKDYTTWNNIARLNFTISNLSSRIKTYKFSHTPAAMMQNLWWKEETYNNMYPFYGSARFPTSEVTIGGGGSKMVFVDIVAPVPDPATWGDDAVDLLLPMYTGFITVTNNNDVFTVPYVGQLWDESRWGGAK
ncbi:peptidase S8/S53 domain-containing protein [Rhexocercosporidium sp. MPI-PUGE-AT-0058]|nr:peptidase S8/S53 domain-containing protein [Rhexocercosporidium sp. MPI-PUGE-AT-0058]